MNKVYGAILSPFVRKVLMTLEYKGAAYTVEMVLPFQNDPAYARISPLRKIPGFQDEYVTVSDSTVICDYLDHKYPQPPLYPNNAAERARALWFEEYADTRLQEHLGPGIFFERMVAPGMFKRPPDEDKIRRNMEAMPPHLDYLERELRAAGYLVGAELSIADLSVPSVFLNAHYAEYEVDARRWPKLAAYLKRMWEHPLYVARIEQEKKVLAALAERR